MTELYHHGIKGQRWGVRRFQSPDGTLTAAGKARYKSYKKDWKAYDKLNRHVAASQRHLKEEGILLDRTKDRYEKANKNYQKEMSKSGGFLGLRAGEKARKVANAQLQMDMVGKDYDTAASAYGVAKKIWSQDTNDLRRHVDKMIKTYGKGSINELQTKTVKIGQNKLQKLLQGAPKSAIFNTRGRDTEEFVKTGRTLADMPVVGNWYTAKHIADKELELKKRDIERIENTSNKRKGELKKDKDKSNKLGYDVYTAPSYLKNVTYSNEPEVRKLRAEKEKAKAEAEKEKKKAEKEKKKTDAKAEKEKAVADKQKKLSEIDTELNKAGYVSTKDKKAAEKEWEKRVNEGSKEAIKKQNAYRKKKEKELKRSRKELEKQNRRNAELEAELQGRSKPKRTGGVISRVIGSTVASAAASAAAAAAGPLAGYAAREYIKKRRRKKRKEAWDNFWGVGHSACSYRVVRSDELYHHGIKGQRWGVRRYQNPDGTLTAKGKKRKEKLYAKAEKEYERGINSKYQNRIDPHNSDFQKKLLALKKKEIDEGFNYLENRVKRNAIVGAVIGGIPGAAIATAYTAVRYNKQNLDRERLKSSERKLEDLRQETFRRLNNIQQQIDMQNQINLQNQINQQQIDMQNQINQQNMLMMNSHMW